MLLLGILHLLNARFGTWWLKILAVNPNGQVLTLNQTWSAGLARPNQGVWVTLFLSPQGATLHIYDAAPDAPKRRCLARHPFPLKEPVVPLPAPFSSPS